jgi:hypothetical protein
MSHIIDNKARSQVSDTRRKFRTPRSRQTLKIGNLVITEHLRPPEYILPVTPVNSDASRRRHQVHHQDFRASAARGRSRQELERVKAHLREARLSLEIGNIIKAKRATDTALRIVRLAGSAPQLLGTPL